LPVRKKGEGGREGGREGENVSAGYMQASAFFALHHANWTSVRMVLERREGGREEGRE
jgi:hypothetical protein